MGSIFREEDRDPNYPDGEVSIPERFQEIGHGVFRNFTWITVLILPDTLTKIGEAAFYRCSGLTEVRLPDTLTEIGKGAFCGCYRITKIRLPDTLTKIGEEAFLGCSGLIKIRLPATLTEIGESVFGGCSGLTNIRLPDTLTEIGHYAFDGCFGLTELSLPDILTKIGDGAFFECSGLTELRLPGSIESLGALAFYRCTSLRFVAMHSWVKLDNWHGDSQQFADCTSLTSVSAPAQVASRFPADMFEDCGTAQSALLANVPADLQLWYYWSHLSHFRCSSVAKETVLTVMLVGYRLEALPNEMWFSVLGFCTRHSLVSC